MSRNARKLLNSAAAGTSANGVKATEVQAGNFITTTLAFSSIPVTVAFTFSADIQVLLLPGRAKTLPPTVQAITRLARPRRQTQL
jgi:hypothetical protein